SPASAPSSAVVLPSPNAALPQHAALPAATAAAAAASQTLQVEVSVAGVLVSAAFGANPTQIRPILAGAKGTGTAASTAARSGPSAAQGRMSAGAELATGQASAAKTTPMQAGAAQAAAAPRAAAAAAVQLTGMTGSGLGFDTCTVPSAATM